MRSAARLRRRGYTLIAVLWFISLLAVMSLAMNTMLGNARHQLRVKQQRLAAREMARSGLEYARVRGLRTRYDSPVFLTGRFRVEPSGGGLRATGWCGGQSVVETWP